MNCFITVDGGTTNTRISLVRDGTVTETKKIAIGAKDYTHGTESLKKAILREIDNICLHISIIKGLDFSSLFCWFYCMPVFSGFQFRFFSLSLSVFF